LSAIFHRVEVEDHPLPLAPRASHVTVSKNLSGRDQFKAVAALQDEANRAKMARVDADKLSDKAGRNALAD
jgi:hypothetical protein